MAGPFVQLVKKPSMPAFGEASVSVELPAAEVYAGLVLRTRTR